MSSSVSGTFDSERGVTRAVRRLSEESVPADAIDVYVLNANGERDRRVRVEDESGVVRGAAWGAAVGGVLGLLLGVLTLAGYLGPVGVKILGVGSVLGLLRVVVVGAVAGVPVGGVLGMGMWNGGRKIARGVVEDGRVEVVVENDALAETARKVLHDAGASDVTTR